MMASENLHSNAVKEQKNNTFFPNGADNIEHSCQELVITLFKNEQLSIMWRLMEWIFNMLDKVAYSLKAYILLVV
uniref:Uncharacterized protein n=1 Tax=Tanacetum cinerariifolium TaxID=118510 RepID=A0A6L2M7Y0_TANCI|nr:hypothetical protein [Tanacetum cinerariifolium]